MDGDAREIELLRVKVETRSWFLRCSLALNITLLGAFAGFVLNKVA